MTTTKHATNDRDAAYNAALALVQQLDPHPKINTACRIDGKWCHTLNEAINALEAIAQRVTTR